MSTTPEACPKISLHPQRTADQRCGAEPVVDGHCLAHLKPETLQGYLSGLEPGSPINVRRVVFTADLLERLLAAVSRQDRHPELGHADFRGATFTGDVDLGGVTFSGDVDFGGVTFTGDVDFRSVTITGGVDFRGATFTKYPSFGGATFIGGAYFGGATFTEGAYFGGATFTKRAYFGDVTFTRDVFFGDAIFIEGAHFGNTTFTKTANFAGATFTQVAVFEGATFTKDAWFDGVTFEATAVFRHVSVEGRLELRGCARELTWVGAEIAGELEVEAAVARADLSRMRASGRVGLRLRGTRVDMEGAVFTGPVTVHGLQTPIEGVDEAKIDWGGEGGGQVPAVVVCNCPTRVHRHETQGR